MACTKFGCRWGIRPYLKKVKFWVSVFVNVKKVYFHTNPMQCLFYLSLFLSFLSMFTVNMTQWWLASVSNQNWKVLYLSPYEVLKIIRIKEGFNGPSWCEFMRRGCKSLHYFWLMEKQENGHLNITFELQNLLLRDHQFIFLFFIFIFWYFFLFWGLLLRHMAVPRLGV